jgi:Fe(3+) dicitrate transport protein
MKAAARRSVMVAVVTVASSSAGTAVADEPVQEPAPAPAKTQDDAPAKAPDEKSELRDAVDSLGTSGDEILVIGRRLPAGVPVVPIDAVGSRDVFGPTRVRETGARDMNELINNMPAISTRPYNGGEGAAPSFSMRGLPDDGLTEYVNVLIDGVPAGPMPYGWTAFSFLPVTPERVYAVDLIRGAHSVRYSPNTVGGVLNFVTQPIPGERRFDARTTLGNLGFSSSYFSVGGTEGAVGALLTVVDRRGDGYRDDGEFEQFDSNLKLRLDCGAGRWFAASVSRMESEHQAPGGLTLEKFEDDRFANSRPRNRFDGDRTVYDLVGHTSVGNGWIEGFTSYAETSRRLVAQRPNFGTPTTMRDWTDDSEVWIAGFRGQRTVSFLGVDHVLFGGGRYLRERLPHYRVDSEPFAGGAETTLQDSAFELDSWSLHLDDTVAVTEKLSVQAGVRWEDVARADGDDPILGFEFDDDFEKVLPGVGASYQFAEEAALFANAFEGFRAPQVWGFGSTIPGVGLDFEESNSAEVGVRVRGLHGVSGSIVRWGTRFDDVAVFFDGKYQNLGRIESEGTDVEIGLDVGHWLPALKGLTLGGSATDQDSTLKSGPDDGNETPYAWEQKAAWTARYETADHWVVSIGGTYVGPSFSDSPNTRTASADGTLGVNPSRTLWDARVGKTWDLTPAAKLDVAVGCTNLFDEEWYVHSRGGFFGGGKVAGPPRQTYVSVGVSVQW